MRSDLRRWYAQSVARSRVFAHLCIAAAAAIVTAMVLSALTSWPVALLIGVAVCLLTYAALDRYVPPA